ncbi:CaiB/BaiF CoA transferase family protein [Acinetobacter sp. ANC 3813]|uniref:CaiB/BaiF CoA transferase family protein n=1 Tax=Acinetobacter sp. ANC 3813 TaxID=1977873 RepID=UPI000A33F9A4|nr:hypothetical protein B9T34_05990 [Acinetobacter sp. ANC 3813]
MGALTGFRILDLSRILAGPWCSQILADLGAEVIKIEKPDHGDDTRIWGPPWLKNNSNEDTHESAYYLSANRGKHSVAVDISTPAGQTLIHKLVLESDVVIENYKAGSLKRYSLDYETLSTLNPKIVYCSITGFGQNGPRAAEPGYDFIVQGMGGMMSVTGERDDLPGGGPQKAGLAFADLTTGLYSAIAIQAALLSREMVIKMPHTLREDYTSIGSPIKLSKTPVEYKKAPPCLGEDTDTVLSQFISQDEIAQLKAQGVIQQR